ncbi:uncharacterized protein [Nicotiana tomentosiformis]|uniref:uncharacterized protein n=1 Tax=Nicotiana tomentosiformis TaxID=4098 RepID=UPI00388C514A
MAQPASIAATTSATPPRVQGTPAPVECGAARGGAPSSGGPSRFYALRGHRSSEAFIDVVTVVNEFPDELPGIPQDREIDFGINVMPGTEPISIPTYKMAPAKLKELKEQLKDMLEKYVAFLRNVLSSEVIMVDPKKIATVKNWPRPTTPTEIRSFLGLAGREFTNTKSWLFNDGTLRYQERLYVPNVDGLYERIMTKAHSSKYPMHPGSTKMYHYVKEVYWLNDMKRDVADYVGRCPKCQQVKGEHQKPGGLTNMKAERTIQTLEDMLCACVLDFKGSWDDYLPLIEISYNNIYNASIQMELFKALYGRRCRSLIVWFEVVEAQLIGPDLIHQAMEKVKIIKKERKIESKVVGDPSLIVPVEAIEVNEELTYEEIPVAILDGQVWKLRNKEIASVKVLWRNYQVEEATWEAGEEMKGNTLTCMCNQMVVS